MVRKDSNVGQAQDKENQVGEARDRFGPDLAFLCNLRDIARNFGGNIGEHVQPIRTPTVTDSK
jgi:hypothetical protein